MEPKNERLNLLNIIQPRLRDKKWYYVFKDTEKLLKAEENRYCFNFDSFIKKKPLNQLDYKSLDFSELGVKRCLCNTFESLVRYTRSNAGSFYIVEDDKIQKIINRNGCFTHGMKWPVEIGTTLAAYVAATKEYKCFNKVCDFSKDEKFPLGTAMYLKHPRSVMCIPAITPQKLVIAVFELVRYEMIEYRPIEIKFALGISTFMAKALVGKFQRIQEDCPKTEFNDNLLNIFYKYSKGEIDKEELVSEIMVYTRDEIRAKQIWYYETAKRRKNEFHLYEEGKDNPDKLYKKARTVHINHDLVVSFAWNTNKFFNILNNKLKSSGLENSDINSTMCVPFGTQNKVIGLAKVINKHNSQSFTTYDAAKLRQSLIYCVLAANHSTYQEEYSFLENAFHRCLKVILHYSFNCEHGSAMFLSNLASIKLPKNFNKFSFYPNEKQRSYLLEYTWWMFREMFENEPFFYYFALFLSAVRQTYRPLPYHNFEHVFVTTHTIFLILRRCKDEFSKKEKVCFMLAGLCHDLDHPGWSNKFVTDTNHPWGKLYPHSYLEFHHSFLARLFIDHYNILAHLSDEEYKEYIEEIHKMILYTDLEIFFENASSLEDLLRSNSYNDKCNRDLMKSIVMTASDLSGQAKIPTESHRIAGLWFEELHFLGDEYKKLGISPVPSIMDRQKFFPFTHAELEFLRKTCEQSICLLSIILPSTQKLYQLFKKVKAAYNKIIPYMSLVMRNIENQEKMSCDSKNQTLSDNKNFESDD